MQINSFRRVGNIVSGQYLVARGKKGVQTIRIQKTGFTSQTLPFTSPVISSCGKVILT